MGQPKSEKQIHTVLDQIIGYLNFASGNHDPKFFANLNQVFAFLAGPSDESAAESKAEPVDSGNEPPSLDQLAFRVGDLLAERVQELSRENSTFKNVDQAQNVLELVFGSLLRKYREHHTDLLFHQSDELVFNSFFVGRAIEAALQIPQPYPSIDQAVKQGLHRLNDFLGHRPVAVLESQKIEPYDHEWIRPTPIYIKGAGVAFGKYQQLTSKAIEFLYATPPDILRAAHFDPDRMLELAIDPRAFDFDHPINQRPNHHFGQWDEQLISENGYFQRFIVHQVTLDSVLDRAHRRAADPGDPVSLEETIIEAAAVLAGTMLMASGICGSGPGTHDSNTTLSSLLPLIANYRDEFYKGLVNVLEPSHRARIRDEAKTKHQPFGGVRQDLNAQLAQRRASQLVNCRLAAIFARMGHPEAAEQQSAIVPVAAARIHCQIDCMLSAAHEATRKGQLDEAFAAIPAAMKRLKQGIQCGAIVDPWNILGFDANYSLFPAVENSVRDHRIYDLLDIIDRIFALCSVLWSEAAAGEREEMCQAIRKEFSDIVEWWRQFAAHEVMSIGAVDADDIFESSELVAEALTLWHQGGAAAGDIEFWAEHAEMFDSPKAYALVIDALMQRHDYTTSTALLVHWLSQAEYVPLQHGDSSFNHLMFRWIAEQKNLLRNQADDETATPPEEIWNRIRKFYDFVEANAEHYWEVPDFEADNRSSNSSTPPPLFDDDDDDDGVPFGDEESDGDNELYRAAYDEVIYTDTTDDGFDGEVFDGNFDTDESLEAEADRVLDRLEFLSAIAVYWSVAATIPLPITRRADLTDSIKSRLEKRRGIIAGWVSQAKIRLGKLMELLDSINRYRIPQTGSDHQAMLLYDEYRLHKDSLLEQTINTCIETENSIRMLASVVEAIDFLTGERTLLPELTETPAGPTDGDETHGLPRSNASAVVRIYASLLLEDAKLVHANFDSLTDYLKHQSLLYVPLSKGGEPSDIVRARVVQTAILDLLRRMPTLGLLTETYELTKASLEMERNNPIGRGAVTEFDEIFEVAFTSMVHSLVQSTAALKAQRVNEGELDEKAIKEEAQAVLFDCIEMLAEAMLVLWFSHSKTLRLSVLEKVHKPADWKRLVGFIENYGAGLFTQQFLHLANIRAILHQGVGHWLDQVVASPNTPDLRLFDELDHVLPREDAVRCLTLILESVIENYNEYRDYNTTTTQSDSGELLYMFLDFLRLRSRYDRVCWNLKPVVWAHRILVDDQENGVARMWRRSLTDKVEPEAEKYLGLLAQLRKKYSIRMESVGRRLEGRFRHQMQIDRLKALVGPAMEEPGSRKSERAFELLRHEAQAFSRSTVGVGIDLPAWLATLENEVQQHLLPRDLREPWLNATAGDHVIPPIAEMREQLEKLPRNEE